MIYVMSDIHGEFNKFIKALDLIQFSDDDKLYILGDIVDRGNRSLEMIEFCMQNQKSIELLMGNHEDLMLSFYAGEIDYKLWFLNGGAKTYNQFEPLSVSKKLDILNFLETRPLAKVIENFILVHAGMATTGIYYGQTVEEIMDMQSKEWMLWAREEFINCPTGLEGYTIVFGHTPTKLIYEAWNEESPIPLTIWRDEVYGGDKIGIDCGAPFSDGRLGVLRLDDMKEFYV